MQITWARTRVSGASTNPVRYRVNLRVVFNADERALAETYGVSPLLPVIGRLHSMGDAYAYQELVSPTGLTFEHEDATVARREQDQVIEALQHLVGEYWPAARAFENQDSIMIAQSGLIR